jgi:hypothetical protein
VKLAHCDYQPFRKEVAAQSGKGLTTKQAAILTRLSRTLG